MPVPRVRQARVWSARDGETLSQCVLRWAHRRDPGTAADDHPILREALRAVLTREPDLHVEGEAGRSLEALERCDQLRPDGTGVIDPEVGCARPGAPVAAGAVARMSMDLSTAAVSPDPGGGRLSIRNRAGG